MELREWALIAFTIMGQMSVGAFLVLGLVHLYAARKANMQEADRMSDRALIAIILVLGLGLLASLFHLGNPANAPKAVTNFATSWLSREILSGVVFAVLGVIFAGMQWFKLGPFWLRNVVAWLAALVGLVLVYSMSKVYMLPTQPGWNTLATPVSFFATTLLLGLLAIGVALAANYAYLKAKKTKTADVQAKLLRDVLKWIAVASVMVLGVELVVIPAHLGTLATGTAPALEMAQKLVGDYRALFILRLVLVFLGAGVFGVFIYQTAANAGKEKTLGWLAFGAFALVLVAEVIGRFLYYATQSGFTL
jgi:anaerobic dimethyl sulfoxide reductase subunit C (anchor subunit)